MAIVYINGFEAYENLPDLITDPSLDLLGDATISTTTGVVHGSSCLHMTGNASIKIHPTFENTSNTVMIAFHQELSTNAIGTYRLKDAGGLDLLVFTFNLTLEVHNGDGAQLINHASGIVKNETSHVSIKATIDGINGLVEMYENLVLVASSPVSSNTTNANSLTDIPTSFRMANDTAGGGGWDIYLDNLIIANDQGAINNDLLGDVGVLRIAPSGDNSVQWTPDSGGTNYTQVNQVVGETSITSVESDNIGDTDLYDMSDLPATGNPVLAVQAKGRFFDQDPSPKSVKLHVNTGAYSNESGALVGQESRINQNMQLLTHQDGIGGSVPWTEAAVNAIVAGVEVV